jgi:hypothetical protein
VGWTISCSISARTFGGGELEREATAPMPPVLGPWSVADAFVVAGGGEDLVRASSQMETKMEFRAGEAFFDDETPGPKRRL